MNLAADFEKYWKSLISDEPADLSSAAARHFQQTIPRFPDEAVYIYSFKENRMIYASGWEEILGYRDDEINMLLIVNLSTPRFAPFSEEVNRKALKFILSKTEQLEKYSFSIELKKRHKNGAEVPIIARVGVYEVENNRVVSIIGNFRVDHSLYFGKVMRYAAYGPEREEFELELDQTLFYEMAISNKEKEALALAAAGYSFKEMADELGVSVSAIEKRINPLYKRFNVKSLAHLVAFAYENHILP
ncbi:MAG: LuxR C-terminal-related transcriptional regulator [Ferruginibacter sp.]